MMEKGEDILNLEARQDFCEVISEMSFCFIGWFRVLFVYLLISDSNQNHTYEHSTTQNHPQFRKGKQEQDLREDPG